MLADVKSLMLGELLSQRSKKQLTDCLLENKIGGPRLRSRLDKNWRVADESGSGERGTVNDLGLSGPPNRHPVIAQHLSYGKLG
jgi:beta-lactamase class A